MSDLRGFRYPLEPLRQRARWQLDSCRAELAAVQRDIERALAERERLQDQQSALASHAAPRVMGAIDPAASQRCLAYLADGHRRLASTLARIGLLEAQRDVLAQRALEQQLKVDAMERHREENVAQHIAASTQRAAAELDSAWLARLQWRRLCSASATKETST